MINITGYNQSYNISYVQILPISHIQGVIELETLNWSLKIHDFVMQGKPRQTSKHETSCLHHRRQETIPYWSMGHLVWDLTAY